MGLFDKNEQEEMVVTNKYLDDSNLGLELISDLQAVSEPDDDLDLELEKLEKLIEIDYLDIARRSEIENRAELYQQILEQQAKIKELTDFPWLIDKQIVGVGGRFSAGKSQFVNSILGEDDLPTDTTPTTAIPTYITYGNEDEIVSYNIFGSDSVIDKDALTAITHEFYKTYQLSFNRIVQNIVLHRISSPYKHLVFLDTPGYTKARSYQQQDNTDKKIAKKHLQTVDYLIWLIDIEQGTVPKQDIDFLNELNFNQPIFFIFNKADKKTTSKAKKILARAESNLSCSNLKIADIIAYSSREKREYFGEQLEEYLTNLDQPGQQNLVAEWEEIFDDYMDYYQQLPDYQEQLSNLEDLKEVVDNEEAIVELIDQIKRRQYKIEQLEDELKRLKGKIKEQTKYILNLVVSAKE